MIHKKIEISKKHDRQNSIYPDAKFLLMLTLILNSTLTVTVIQPVAKPHNDLMERPIMYIIDLVTTMPDGKKSG